MKLRNLVRCAKFSDNRNQEAKLLDKS